MDKKIRLLYVKNQQDVKSELHIHHIHDEHS